MTYWYSRKPLHVLRWRDSSGELVEWGTNDPIALSGKVDRLIAKGVHYTYTVE